MKTIKLREGKERSALRRHPWIFDSAIAKGGGDAGETVRVEANDGKFLGWASFSPESKIRARIWSFDEGQRIDASFFKASIACAIAARSRFDIQSNGVRLIHGESDGLPGLIVDRYDDILVASFLSCGTERWKNVIADELLAQTGLTKLYERSDSIGSCRSTWLKATRRVFIWTNATAAKSLQTMPSACSFSACSIVIATQAVSPSPLWRVVRPM